MSKTLNRLVFAVGMMAAPLVMVGCSEGEKPAASTPAPEPTKAPEGAPAPDATKPAPDAAPAPAPAPTEPAKP